MSLAPNRYVIVDGFGIQGTRMIPVAIATECRQDDGEYYDGADGGSGGDDDDLLLFAHYYGMKGEKKASKMCTAK